MNCPGCVMNNYEFKLKHDYIVNHGHYPLYVEKDSIDLIVGLLQDKRSQLKEAGKYHFDVANDEGEYAFCLESTLMSAEMLQKVFQCEKDERHDIHKYIERFAPEKVIAAEYRELEKMYSDSDDDE